MKTRRIGRTGVEVTELGFGAAPIANLYAARDPEVAEQAVRAAWSGGIRYFDTAPHYGLGLSERRLGAVLSTLPRDEFVVSTKVGRLLVPNPQPTGSDLESGGFDVDDALTRKFDYSRDGVRRSLEASLGRLGLDRVDVVYVHDPENAMDQAISAAVPALVELRDSGVIRAIGAGMNFVEPLTRFVSECDVDVVMVAGRWTLLDRSAEPLVELCAERGVSLVSAAPFNSGMLARPDVGDDATFDYAPASGDRLDRARRMAQFCSAKGVELPQAALQFALRSTPVAAVVAGLGSADEVSAAITRIETAMPDDLWPQLDAAADLGPDQPAHR